MNVTESAEKLSVVDVRYELDGAHAIIKDKLSRVEYRIFADDGTDLRVSPFVTLELVSNPDIGFDITPEVALTIAEQLTKAAKVLMADSISPVTGEHTPTQRGREFYCEAAAEHPNHRCECVKRVPYQEEDGAEYLCAECREERWL